MLPKFKEVLEQRKEQIQGEMEKAEATRGEAEKLQEEYRTQLAGARDEANRIIEEARATADQLRRDLQAKAEEESQAIVGRAQEEIRAERDRVFQELRAQVGSIAVEIAGRVVGQSLDEKSASAPDRRVHRRGRLRRGCERQRQGKTNDSGSGD